jgi:uncharacterized phage protein (TIGR01671 family)
MTREIKFRAWNMTGEIKMLKVRKLLWEIDSNDGIERLYFEGILPEEKPVYGIGCVHSGLGAADGSEESGWILMQYTGLHDKNGKEIYEGDIITYIQELCEYEKREVSPARDFVLGNYVVAWHEESAEWGLIYDWSNKQRISGGLGFWRKRVRSGKQENVMEVIGNIYENKELLS